MYFTPLGGFAIVRVRTRAALWLIGETISDLHRRDEGKRGRDSGTRLPTDRARCFDVARDLPVSGRGSVKRNVAARRFGAVVNVSADAVDGSWAVVTEPACRQALDGLCSLSLVGTASWRRTGSAKWREAGSQDIQTA